MELRWVKANRATSEGIMIVCDQILENWLNCHIEYLIREIPILNIQLLETSQSLYIAELVLHSINTLIH